MRTLCALLGLLVAAPAAATTLTFDTNPPLVVDNRVLPQEYGDRVVDTVTDALGTGAAAAGSYGVGAEGATPNVEVVHDSTGDLERRRIQVEPREPAPRVRAPCRRREPLPGGACPASR